METTYFIPEGCHAEIVGNKVVIKQGVELENSDLEKEIHSEVTKLHTIPCYDELAAFAHHFAIWQKQQIMKEAIEGYVDQVEYPGSTWIELSDPPKDLKDGDNIKLIIIKE